MSVVPSPSPLIPIAPVPVEAPPPPLPEAAQAQPPTDIAKQFAALSRKERSLFKQDQAIKAEKASLEVDRARIAELEAKYGSKPATPREALERYGFDYKTATDFELNDNAPTPEFIARQAQEEVRKLRQEQVDREERDQKAALKRAEDEKVQVTHEFKTEIQEFVKGTPDEYELINWHGPDAIEVVYLTIEEHYLKTGKLLSIPEGANIVEKYLEKRGQELQGLKKFAKQREQGNPPEPESGFGRQPVATAQRRTIDNTATASTPTLVRNPQVEDDRMKRALAALDRR